MLIYGARANYQVSARETYAEFRVQIYKQVIYSQRKSLKGKEWPHPPKVQKRRGTTFGTGLLHATHRLLSQTKHHLWKSNCLIGSSQQMENWLTVECYATMVHRRNHTCGLVSVHSVLQGVWQRKRKLKPRLLSFILYWCFPRLSSFPGSASCKLHSLMRSFSSWIFSLLL